MGISLQLIGTQTVSGTPSYVEFTNIPQSFKHLRIIWSGKSSRALQVDGTKIRFNADLTDGNYSGVRMYGDSSSTPTTDTNGISGGPFSSAASSGVNVFGASEFSIFNYSSSTLKKSMLGEGGQIDPTYSSFHGIHSMLWSSTAAITSLRLYPEVGSNWTAGSTAYLYGIG